MASVRLVPVGKRRAQQGAVPVLKPSELPLPWAEAGDKEPAALVSKYSSASRNVLCSGGGSRPRVAVTAAAAAAATARHALGRRPMFQGATITALNAG